MIIDTFFGLLLIIGLVAARRRKGIRPVWAKRADRIMAPVVVLSIIAALMVGAEYGSKAIWIVRLAYIPLVAAAWMSSVRER
jgi:peptidoglycan/LPS O-acetylase OafA/YrhL